MKDKFSDIDCGDKNIENKIIKIFENISIKYSDKLDVDVYKNVNNIYTVELIYGKNIFFIDFGSKSFGWFSEINDKISHLKDDVSVYDIESYKILNNDINEFVNKIINI